MSTSLSGPSRADAVVARASHMMGAHSFGEEEAMAWEGLLEVSRRLRRGAEEAILEEFELSVSMLGIMGRLSAARARTLRQTELAEAMGLSLSRVSRVVDLLEQRGLVARRDCPSDARATNVKLTAQGASLTARAQRCLATHVQASFLNRLDGGEAQVLAALFRRLIEASPLA